MKKLCSIDQTVLKNICDKACDDIESLLNYFDIEYKANPRFYSMSCPIHAGDNPSAVNIYHVGDSYRGNWKCRTHGCEKIFKASILGFIRGVLSRQKLGWQKKGDKIIHFGEVLSFMEKFLHTDLNNIDTQSTEHIDKQKFVVNMSIFNNAKQPMEPTSVVSRQQARSMLSIPSTYFMNRGFSADILDKYDVGDCINQSKPMFGRAVVPIYDSHHHYMIGCSGRSIYGKCDICSYYHIDKKCPSKDYMHLYSKWRHSKGFKTDNSLYNLWYAKDYIKQTRTAIIVESPGNVWKLEMAGIHNSVGIYGSSLTHKQKLLLDTTGAMTLIILTDNDEAGAQCRSNIEKQCCKIYNIEHVYANNNDVAEMDVNDIKQLMGKFI